MYEPLLGGPKDDRIVTAPAVRIAVLKCAFGHERPARLQQPNYGGIGIEYRFAPIFWQAFREAPVIVQGRVCLQAIFLTHREVLGSMPRSRMHDAATLLQRDMLAEHSGNDSIEKGVLKLGTGKAVALKSLGD